MVDSNSGLATVILYRYRPMATKAPDGGINLDVVDDEAFLEIKIPLTELYSFSRYIKDMVEDLRRNPQMVGHMFFGPTYAVALPEKPDTLPKVPSKSD